MYHAQGALSEKLFGSRNRTKLSVHGGAIQLVDRMGNIKKKKKTPVDKAIQVLEAVLKPDAATDRGTVLGKLIDLADHCHELGNFNSS